MAVNDNGERDLYIELYETLLQDDKDSFLKLLRDNPRELTKALDRCGQTRAKKCLTELISGDLWETICTVTTTRRLPTPLATLCYYFPDPDLINLILDRGVEGVNTKCSVLCYHGLPLDFVLATVARMLKPWTPGDSIFKLVILLCQWKTKSYLDSARLLTRYTRSVNEVAWSYVTDGRLVELGALLLIAREKVLVPFESGLTLQQRINDVFDAISSEGDRYSDYKSMLGDACKLLDILERAGDCLSVYRSSMHKPVPPENVLVDVTGMLKKAGFLLQSVDLDLRDNFRRHPQLCKSNLFKLSDLPSPDPYATRAQGSGTTHENSSYNWDLLQRLKSGTMLNLASSGPLPRMFSTASHHHGSSSSLMHLAYAALKLKQGSRFL